MDAVLRMPMAGMEFVVPWRRVLSGILLVACCLGVYVFGLNRTDHYEEVPAAARHPVTGPDGMRMENVCDSVKMPMDDVRNALPEKIIENAALPVAVSEPMAADLYGGAAADSSEELGKIGLAVLPDEGVSAVDGTGNTADEACAATEELREISGFLCDADGYITGYTDKVSVTDGILVIPADENCVGIVKGALDGLGEETTEIYIPANIVDIEPGVFDRFASLFYIEAAAGNPSYYSREGILYTISGGIFFRPAERLMTEMECE